MLDVLEMVALRTMRSGALSGPCRSQSARRRTPPHDHRAGEERDRDDPLPRHARVLPMLRPLSLPRMIGILPKATLHHQLKKERGTQHQAPIATLI